MTLKHLATEDVIGKVQRYARIFKAEFPEEIVSELFVKLGNYEKKHGNLDNFFENGIPNYNILFISVRNIVYSINKKDSRFEHTVGYDWVIESLKARPNNAIELHSVNLFSPIEQKMIEQRVDRTGFRKFLRDNRIGDGTYRRIRANIKIKIKKYYYDRTI